MSPNGVKLCFCMVTFTVALTHCQRQTNEKSVFGMLRKNDVAGIERYLDSGGSPNIFIGSVPERKTYAVHCAAEFGRVAMCRLLYAHGADFNALDGASMTALMVAIGRYPRDPDRLYENIQYLLSVSNVRLTNQSGRNALHMAACSTDQRTIDLFRKLPVYDELLRCQDNDGNTPEYYMLRRGFRK